MRLWKILLALLLVLTGSGPSALASIPLAPKNPCTGQFRGVVSGYRYYNPSLGRWLGRDSAGEKGALNLFLFIANCPPTHYDTLGDMDRNEYNSIVANIEGTFDNIAAKGNPYTTLSGLGANLKGEYLMFKWFHSGGQYDFSDNGRQGEMFDVPGFARKLTSDEATDVLVGVAAGYATFKTGVPGYSVGVGAASLYYGAIDFAANYHYGDKAQAIAGIATATSMEANGYLTGAIDALDSD